MMCQYVKASLIKPLVSLIVLMAFTCATVGCSSTRSFLVEQRQQIKEPHKIYSILTTNDKVIDFESDSLGNAVLNDTTLTRFLSNDSTETISLSTVKVLYTNEPDPKRTGIAILVGAGFATLIISSLLTHGLNFVD
jgi:hypothetical protein